MTFGEIGGFASDLFLMALGIGMGLRLAYRIGYDRGWDTGWAKARLWFTGHWQKSWEKPE